MLRRREFLAGFLKSVAAVTLLGGCREARADWRSYTKLRRLNDAVSARRAEEPDALAGLIKSVSNVFEVGHPQTDYAYVENLHDGRGYTVTSYGFCTGTGEVSRVIRRYQKVNPETDLGEYADMMPPDDEDTSTHSDFAEVWRNEVHSSPLLAQVCEQVANKIIYEPAMSAARSARVRLPVGKLVFYDTWLQHGGDKDEDSFQAILATARKLTGRRGKGTSEVDFIRNFLAARRDVLTDPGNESTTHAWRKSVPRIEALSNILECNPFLTPPIVVSNVEVHAIET
jgi:chitosanase